MSESHFFEIESIDDFRNICLEVASLKRKVIFLEGGLGAGKTTFVSQYVRFVFREDPVEMGIMSPTFSIVNEYFSNGLKIMHADFYRSGEKDFDSEELLEMIEDASLVFIEWPSKIKDWTFLNKNKCLTVNIDKVSESSRTVKF